MVVFKIGVNAISADTINKKPLVDWKQWQNKCSEEIFLKWIELFIYKGLVIISGISYREKKRLFFPLQLNI